MFLYTQPPSALKFFPVKKDVYLSRGAVVVMDKREGSLPELVFYRFEFWLHMKGGIVADAKFTLEELRNFEEATLGTHLTWAEIREDTFTFLAEAEARQGGMDIEDHGGAIHYWSPYFDKSFSGMESFDELKSNFIRLIDGVFVVCHYFETEWVILTGKTPIKINFRGA